MRHIWSLVHLLGWQEPQFGSYCFRGHLLPTPPDSGIPSSHLKDDIPRAGAYRQNLTIRSCLYNCTKSKFLCWWKWWQINTLSIFLLSLLCFMLFGCSVQAEGVFTPANDGSFGVRTAIISHHLQLPTFCSHCRHQSYTHIQCSSEFSFVWRCLFLRTYQL